MENRLKGVCIIERWMKLTCFEVFLEDCGQFKILLLMSDHYDFDRMTDDSKIGKSQEVHLNQSCFFHELAVILRHSVSFVMI